MSLLDSDKDRIALPKGHPFIDIKDWFYKLSTTNTLHPDDKIGE